MKKLLVVALVFAVMGFAVPVMAQGDFEVTGHINTGMGYQHQDQYAGDTSVRVNPGLILGEGIPTNDAQFGTIGNPRDDAFEFFVDEVELDITKSFGENIRLRADLDLGQLAIGTPSNNGNFNVEQGYITLNVPVGNGMEFLVGRFNAPIGFEAVDRNDNDTFSHSAIYQYWLRPHNLTGLKFYYAFSDLVDFHLYAVNNLRDAIDSNRVDFPSFGMRLGFTWGEEGNQSTIGISGAAGPDVADGTNYGDWSYLADVDFNIWATESFAIGGEGIFRVDDTPEGFKKAQYYGGLLNLHYVFNDVWDGTLKYCWVLDRKGGANYRLGHKLGDHTQVHQIGLAGQYHITDGAKMQIEYRLDWSMPSGGRHRSITHGGVLAFAYEF